MMRASATSSVAILLSLLVAFVAERIFGEGTGREVSLGIAGLLFFAGLGLRLVRRARANGSARAVESQQLWFSIGILAGVGIYAFSTDAGVALLGYENAGAERAQGALGALWPAVTIVALGGLLFTEQAYFRMPIEEAVEPRRVRASAQGGVSLALALVFLFSINYVASEQGLKWDLSYFRTTEPSESTLRMVESLSEPIEVVLMYPEVNEVYDQLTPYFQQVSGASEQLEVRQRDHALAASMAQQHRIRGNGFVVLLRGEGEEQQAESFEVGLTLESARTRLRRLDGSFQRAFTSLARVRRELYLTTGHRERSVTGAEGDSEDQRMGDLGDALSRSGFESTDLGIAQGLATDVPDAAPAVAIFGPRTPFRPEEIGALERYVSGGGRLLVALDPNDEHGLGPLLRSLGVGLQSGIAASARNYRRLTNTTSDRGLVYSNVYSAHPIVSTARRNAARLATIFVHGGALRRVEGQELNEGLRVTFPLRSAPGFWLDQDGDWDRSDSEPEAELNLIAAVTVPNEGGEEGRVIVIADADFTTDLVFRNPGNALIFGDIMQWFLGEEQIIGDTATEEDVPIEHTRDEDKLWFYATSFGAPLPLLIFGIWIALRGRRRGETPVEAAMAESPEPEVLQAALEDEGLGDQEVDEGEAS